MMMTHCGVLSTNWTNTHIRLTALCPGLHRWASTRKVKPIWILLEQETVSGSGISWDVCKSAPRSRQITTPAPHLSVFTGRMPFLPPNQQRQSTEGSGGTTLQSLLLYFAFALVHDSRGIEIVNFTISLALSAGMMASAGTPYRLVPAHFYPCLMLQFNKHIGSQWKALAQLLTMLINWHTPCLLSVCTNYSCIYNSFILLLRK